MNFPDVITAIYCHKPSPIIPNHPQSRFMIFDDFWLLYIVIIYWEHMKPMKPPRPRRNSPCRSRRRRPRPQRAPSRGVSGDRWRPRGNAVELTVELAGTRWDSHGFANIIISNIFKYQIFIKYSNISWNSWYKYDICICSIFIDHLLSLTNKRNLCFLLGLSRVLYACLWDIVDIIPVSKWFSAVLRPPPVTQPPSTAPRTTQAPEFLGAVGCGILEDWQEMIQKSSRKYHLMKSCKIIWRSWQNVME